MEEKEKYTKELNKLSDEFANKRIDRDTYVKKTADIIMKVKALKGLSVKERLKIRAYEGVLGFLDQLKHVNKKMLKSKKA